MAAIIITVILVAAIIGVSSWLIAVTAKSGKYNLIKVKKSGVPNAVSGDPEEYDVEVNGINMHYAVMGKGSPLILIHGNGGSHEELWDLCDISQTIIGCMRRTVAIRAKAARRTNCRTNLWQATTRRLSTR